jgi:hypothetical protein
VNWISSSVVYVVLLTKQSVLAVSKFDVHHRSPQYV